MDQYVVPYLISSHPGSTLADAVALAESVRDMGYMPEQVQDFYPTPSTVSTCMYYTGVDPRTMKPVYVPDSFHEKAMQRALIQYRDPKNYELVKEALIRAGREDLIGYDRKHCLIPPRPMKKDGRKSGTDHSKSGTEGRKSGMKKAEGRRDSRERTEKDGGRRHGTAKAAGRMPDQDREKKGEMYGKAGHGKNMSRTGKMRRV